MTTNATNNDSTHLLEQREKLKDMKKKKKMEMKKLKKERFENKMKNVPFKSSSTTPKSQIEKIEYLVETTRGEKKDTKNPLPEKYSSSFVEAAWYSWWVKQGFFKPEYGRSMKELEKLPEDKKLTIVIPPPNVTGTLHIGHALMCSIQDCVSRWSRMRGKAVLWNPGSDHAGIATQVVVEKKLKREKGLSRHDLGRENFLKEVWSWKNEKGVAIYDQMQRLGISVDWDREFFTMDESRSLAVIESFVQLYEKNMVYRSKRLVNWSCSLKSAISDIEVDKIEVKGRQLISVPGYAEKIEFGVITDFSYSIEGSNEKITVSTTRIETMLGDVAIAVHPDDSRYKNFVGKYAVHPFCNRRLIVVADEAVDANFGTGAVKITPGHDAVDYEIGMRHKLEMINIYTEDGLVIDGLGLRPEYERFCGMKRFTARTEVARELQALGLFVGKKDHSYVLPTCSRSKDIIEPLLKSQWYVSCDKMAKKATAAVVNGDLVLVPSNFDKVWFYWMDNIRDWCVSRQLWWGHRIPAYYITSSNPALKQAHRDNPDYWVCARSHQDAVNLAAKRFAISPSEVVLEQDEDVLDTWYSSGILPFSIFGWPKENSDLTSFFPNTLLETGHDILFFWVARMVMLSQELTGKLPFKTVLLHSIVRDSHGRKMSKSLGNIIDPVDVIQGISLEGLQGRLLSYNLDQREYELATAGQKQDFPAGIPECGSDALRFALCAYGGSKKDINLDVYRVQGYRFFCNKIWNAFRFCLNSFGGNFSPSPETVTSKAPIDLWILSRLADTENSINKAMAQYDFTQATSVIYNFWLYDFCDLYIEAVKPIISRSSLEETTIVLNVLFTCVDNGLRLLHPFMPFITEELYQRLPFPASHFDKTPSICIAPFPEALPWRNREVERQVGIVMSTVGTIRSAKDDYLPTKSKVEVYIDCHSDSSIQILQQHQSVLQTLVKASSITFAKGAQIPVGCAVYTNGSVCDVHLAIRGLIDVSKEITRVEEKLNVTRQKLEKLNDSMNVAWYSEKVPEAVQEVNLLKKQELAVEVEKFLRILKNLRIAQ